VWRLFELITLNLYYDKYIDEYTWDITINNIYHWPLHVCHSLSWVICGLGIRDLLSCQPSL